MATSNCSTNPPFWHGQRKPRFSPPQTPFKTYGVVEGFWQGNVEQQNYWLLLNIGIHVYQRRTTMTKQAAVRLPDETYSRLKSLAERTGRTATFYIREAVEEHLEDLEDLYAAEQASTAHRKSGGRTFSLNELDVELGLGN
jgi:RHH-type rel operon transcriptional repressor/antitoxin RelB